MTHKYYGTLVNYSELNGVDLQKLGLRNSMQYRLVIKAKSRAAANREFTRLTGRTTPIFKPAYTSETQNTLEVKLCDLHGAIISSGIARNDYRALQDGLKNQDVIHDSDKKEQ